MSGLNALCWLLFFIILFALFAPVQTAIVAWVGNEPEHPWRHRFVFFGALAFVVLILLW